MPLIHWLQMAIEQYGYIVVLVAVAIESTGIPFPGETALIAGAVYAGTGGRLSIAGVIAAAAIGAILGDNLGFAIGRAHGYRLLRRIAGRLRLNERHLAYAESYFERHGDKTVFFGRFFSILRTWAAFLAGVNRMRWRSFLCWNALGGIVWSLIYGTLGFVLGNNLPLLERIVRFIGWGGTIALAVVALVIFALWMAWRRGVVRSAWLDATWSRVARLLVQPHLLAGRHDEHPDQIPSEQRNNEDPATPSVPSVALDATDPPAGRDHLNGSGGDPLQQSPSRRLEADRYLNDLPAGLPPVDLDPEPSAEPPQS